MAGMPKNGFNEGDSPPLHEGRLFQNLVLLPWSLLQFLYNIKVLKIEVLVALSSLGRIFYTQLSEQYYYHFYGSEILRNTSFVFPDGSFCVTSDLINLHVGNNNSYKLDESESNHLTTYTTVMNTIPSVISTIIFGSLMDRYGRKIGMVFPAVGMVVQAIVSIYIIQYNLNPYYFILSCFISGCFGSFTSTLAASFSYIADISSPRWRSLRVALVEAGLAFGGSFGQFLIGFWLDRVNCDYMSLLYFVTSCFVFIVVFIVFFIPESLTYSERKELCAKNSKGLRTYLDGFNLFCGKLSIRSTWKLYVATIAMNVLAVNIFGDQFVSVYILKALPFDFNPFQIGIYQAVRSVSQGLANLVVMGVLVSLKVSDVWIIVLSITVHVTGDVLIGFSRLPWELYTIATLKGMEGLVWSGGRGLISKLVPLDRQGALFSIIASLESLATLVSTVVWPFIFPLTLQHNMRAGVTYLFMAVLGSLLLPPALSLLCLKKEEMAKENKGSAEHFQSSIEASTEESKPLLGSSWGIRERSVNS